MKKYTKTKSAINKNGKAKHPANYDELLIERFKNDKRFVKSCLVKGFADYIKHEDVRYFTDVLEHAVRAYGVSQIADETKLSRQTIYQLSSKVDSSSLANFVKVLKVFGIDAELRG